MKLSEFKKQLSAVTELNFMLPNGKFVPKHFHITEVGQVNKHFIDCGGTVRNEKVVNLQLWETANDIDHRLAPEKLMKIIELSEQVLNVEDTELEVEYQGDTIGKYGVAFDGKDFILTTKRTDCLASDKCGISNEKQKVNLSELSTTKQSCCTPGGGCC